MRRKKSKRTLLFIYFLMHLCYSRPSTSDTVLSLSEDYFESRGSVYSEDLNEAERFLKKFNVKADELSNKNGLANWAYETDLTEENLQKTVEVGLEVSDFFLKSSENASQIKTLDLPSQIHRQISLIRRSADPTSSAMRREIKETIGKMTSIFGKGKISKGSKNYTLNDLTEIIRKSKNRKDLNWAWRSWRDKVGPAIKSSYSNLVDLLNIGAREHGWIDYGNYLRSDYEMGDDFEINLDRVWKDIEPLYKELHAYVRYKLSKQFRMKKNGCIPANLFGDMFAQDWENIFDIVKPSKKSRTFDVTKELKKQKYTVEKIVQLAERFFVSLGLDRMPESFWNKSVFTKPRNKEMVCHASAWDVSKTDVRIKMCTKVTQTDLATVHHEMGHIEYFLAYKNQPNTFRAGANPGFHEAIGDTISLSVETPSYLSQVGLVKSENLGTDDTINFLLNQALRRIAPIPYNLLVDKWRWRVFEGNITENNYNKEWWNLRVKYQGVEPPVTRPVNAFDPASKYHIGSNVPYVAYFVSYVLQFQLHKAFCKATGKKGPLHACSIYKSDEAGNKLRKMLEAGRSQPWPKILKEATGERDLKATAILEYFEPLQQWLKGQRTAKKYPFGWKEEMSTQVLQKKTKKYEAGQERSGILKTNSGDISLSINIPSVTLNELIKKNAESKEEKQLESSHNSTATNSNTTDSENPEDTSIDLAKLLGSGNSLTIKSSETTATNQGGRTEVKNKQIKINSDGSTDNSAMNKDQTSKESTNSTSSVLPESDSQIKNKTDEKLSHAKEKGSKKISLLSIPLAVQTRPDADFPKVAVSPQEPKQNPKIAGIANESKNPKIAGIRQESKNPIAAAVPQEPKPNPVPNNQIALLPVSLPASVISALKNVLNANITSNNEGNNSPVQDLTASQSHANNTKPSTSEKDISSKEHATDSNPSSADTHLDNVLQLRNTSTPASSSNAIDESPSNSVEKSPSNSVEQSPSNDTSHVSTNDTTGKIENEQQLVSNTSHSEAAHGISPLTTGAKSDSQNDNTLKENTVNATIQLQHFLEAHNLTRYNSSKNVQDSSPESGSFVSTQSVTPCKRSEGSPCMESKVTTEGNSFPIRKSGYDESKQTISVSPSLLIQKLIEHHVAEKSTPDPVVNALPNITKKHDTEIGGQFQENSLNDTKSSNSVLDISKLINVLTGSVANASNISNTSNNNDIADIENKRVLEQENNSGDIKSLTTPEQVSDDLKTSKGKNCSNLVKRGVSISLNCNDAPDHKGGTLSISPGELIQKLLQSKTQNEANKKTIPSARVVKTPNGFQLNFDLNTKDKIPSDVPKKIGRQQHVDVFNTAKGMVVKPKSSLQLLTPLFVPVQNKDNIELGNKEG